MNPVYPFVFMDFIHYKVREDGRILSRAAYIVLDVTPDVYKDILSITVSTNETSKQSTIPQLRPLHYQNWKP
uniref:transposase n=1 Tax=Enterocloster clostridioformis TaxID=1531 RepID=UPI001F021DCE|nr:transposase [Enterocloster clostridioformis]